MSITASHTATGHAAASRTHGLLVAQDGYLLVPEDRLADAGAFAFTILGPDGQPVPDFDEAHDRKLHLIVASRDLRHFAHVHPTADAHGRWSVVLPELPPGAYRAFADFQPAGGDHYTLGVDLVSPGEPAPFEPLTPVDADAVDGFDVSLEREAGGVTLTVRRDGEVVVTEPYLGAGGHLVALRDGDMAYIHVHPLDHEPVGSVRFAVTFPSAGTYALFFDFKADGAVHTARFVLEVDSEAGAGSGSGGGHADHH